jgi:hypothetical protein
VGAGSTVAEGGCAKIDPDVGEPVVIGISETAGRLQAIVISNMTTIKRRKVGFCLKNNSSPCRAVLMKMLHFVTMAPSLRKYEVELPDSKILIPPVIIIITMQ